MHKFCLLAFVIGAFNISVNAQDCTWGGNCLPGDPTVQCYLDSHNCFPASECTGPNCPGYRCEDLYLCFEYDEPCGTLACDYCVDCASGNCPPGVHVAKKEKSRAKTILASIRARNRQRAS